MSADSVRENSDRISTGPGGWMAAASTSLLAAATVVLFAARGFDLSIERQLPVAFLVLELSGVALLAATSWVVARHRPRVSIALALLGLGLLLPIWSTWPLPDPATALALAVAPLSISGAALAALGWHHPRSPAGWLRLLYLLPMAAVLVHLLTYNPFADPGCLRSCVELKPVLASILSTYSGFAITSFLTIAAATTAAFAIVRATPAFAPGIVVVGVLAALAALTTWWVLRWAQWGVRQQSRVLVVLPFLAAALISVAILVAVVRTWRTRASIERLAVRLADHGAALKDLGGAVRDVHFAVPLEERWVDSMGFGVPELEPEDRRIVVSDEGGPIARIVLGVGKKAAEVLEALTPATRLALRNAQLAAATRTRVAQVQASQRRIVAASDAERRRIERDLHDGAQQRLVSAAFQMGLIRSRLPNNSELVARAEMLLGDALGHLRRLAHGVFPTILTSEGLWVALDELVRSSLIPTSLKVTGSDDKIDPETAMAAYATVGEALDQAAAQPGAGPARVSGSRDAGTLQVSIEITLNTDWQGLPDFIDVGDRTGALGGKLSVSSAGGIMVVKAVLPCES